jgi:amino acid adenylation domain-containing protein
MTTNLLVQDFLRQSTGNFPEKVFLIQDEKKLTYLELEILSNRLANQLAENGIQRGDRVVLFLPNIPEQAIAIFGVLKADAVFVVVNYSTKEDKLLYILNNCQAKAIIFPSDQQGLLSRLFAHLPHLKFGLVTGNSSEQDQRIYAFDSFLSGGSPNAPKRKNIDLDLACLIYTSGSTGEPKGVMSDHSNVRFAAQSIISYLKNTADDIILSAAPLSFDYGLYQMLMTTAFGGTLVLEKGFVFPALTLKKIQQYQVTGFPGVPTMFSTILNMNLEGFDFSSLRYMTNTAAALSSWHIEKIKEKFPKVQFYSMYGLTETKRTLYLPPEELEKKPDSVGIPIPGTEAWLVDENDERLGPNQIGELVIRGRHVMRGYWQDEKATQLRYRPGVFPGERVCYSGDLFKMDEDGYFYFIARKDDIIKSRGEKVSPKEVENAIYKLPGVQEVAVIGVVDPILGQAVKAFVILNQKTITENDILRHCKKNLEDFMVPKFIEIIDELPKTNSGKIKKSGLG